MNMDRNEAAPSSGAEERSPIAAHGLTHTGKRPRNEDSHLIREDLGLVVVADGFGGSAGGDIAARHAVDEIADCFGAQEEHTIPTFEPHELTDGLSVATTRFAIEHAHKRIRYESQRTGPPGMATAVAVLVAAGPRVVVGNAGGVRVYRLRGDALEELTRDAPSAVAGGMGACPVGGAIGRVQPTVRAVSWKPGDRFLVCTAGLYRVLSDEAIRCTLAVRGTPAEGAAALVGRALHSGATDNLTAVVAIPGRAAGG